MKKLLVGLMLVSGIANAQCGPDPMGSARPVTEKGTAVIRIIISEAGSIDQLTLLESTGYPKLDQRALEIALQNKFNPYTHNGKPTRISTNFQVKFDLNKVDH